MKACLCMAVALGCLGCGNDDVLVAQEVESPCTGVACEAPQVVTTVPDGSLCASPDTVVRLVFSRPMDTEASGPAFALLGASGQVPGSARWDASATVLAFRPNLPLPNGDYIMVLDGRARAVDGAFVSEELDRELLVCTSTVGTKND